MSQSVFQPVGQKRLTNVAVVRMKRAGKRFEIACYKNKVLSWRAGVESDLDEVLQATVVYQNVSKAILASAEDCVKAFGTADAEAVCLRILHEGDLQVSDRERKVELETRFRDVAAALSERCVNPTTGRPYTIPVLERALRDAHVAVDPRRPSKIQALEALPLLQARFPIERAAMRVVVRAPAAAAKEVLALLDERGSRVERAELRESDGALEASCLIDPGTYRPLAEMLAASGGGVDVLASAAGALHGAEVGDARAPADPAPRPRSADGATSPDGAAPGPRSGPPAPSGDPASALASGLGAASLEDPPRRAAAAAAPARAPRPVPPRRADRASGSGAAAEPPAEGAAPAAYPRGPIAGIPERFASRRERFAELDDLQPGWEVELREREDGDVVDAAFFSPEGARVGAYVAARRAALQAKRAAA